MSELAEKLIAENKAKHARGENASYLDLGRCGLTELPDLSGMNWLETLIVSNEWWDGGQRKWIPSANSGSRNYIAHPPVHSLPNSLQRVTLGGKWADIWPISNFSFLEKLTNLSSLYLGNNKISDYSFLEKLTNLSWLNLHSNQISDGRFLEKLTKLTSLDISNNKISDYSFLEKLTNLSSLDLSSNEISDWHFLEKLTNLTSLDLSSNQISDWRFLEKLTNLNSLDISHNQISDWHFLEKLTNLTSLNLSFNQISDARFLEKLTNLSSLDLSYNQISDARFLEKLTNLNSLYLSNNQISDGRFLERLTKLTSLDLSSNQISDAHFLEKLTNLNELNLRNNQISDGWFLENLTNLNSLYLSNNKISDGRFLEKLTNLNELDLSNNQISDVRFLEKLTNLNELYLSNNQISDVRFLEKLTNLNELDLSNNQISDVRFLEKLTKLNSLKLSSNKISDAQFLEKLTNLNELYLSSNKISDAQFLENLTNLNELYLSSNKISDARFLENLTNLTKLYLSSNKISDGRFLEKLTNLNELYLSNNQISDVQFLEKLTSLTQIDLSNNALDDLMPLRYFIQKKGMEVVLKEWYQTEEGEINVKDNPTTNPPLEIVEQGTDAILRYFEELQTTKAEDIRPLNEAKLIVIGQPRAGKTSLRYKLCDTEREMPQQDDSTRGIDIELQTFDYMDGAGAAQTFQYHIWDFGGQQIYHATHRFFLTRRTVYVAVVDTDVNDKQNDLDYWLHMIELMGDGSPVLLVQNQKNDRSIEISDTLRNRFRPILAAKDYELNLARLRKEDNPKFDAKRLADFQRFKADIQRIFEQQAPILMTPTKSDTRQALEKLSREHPMIELTQYKQLCIENGLKDPLAQTDLLRTLHNLGICLWYEGYDFLERIVILQNRWATDAVFKVLDNETVKKDKGHFRRAQLNQIWSADEYKDRVSELVELMKQFKLCYQIGQTDEYIAPQLLDKNPPEDFSRARIQKDSVRMLIEYEFMPRGIMTQFIVAMHRQISGGQRHAWETGFAVQSQHGPSAVGMAEESYDSRKLELWAQGPGAGLLLQQMLSELEKIHDTFHRRLRHNKLIPCNCERCRTPGASRVKEFEYEEILLEMYQNRQPGIRCSYGNQTVPFDQLLGVLGFTAQQTEEDFWKTRRGEPANTPKSGNEHHYHGPTYILQDQSTIEKMVTNPTGGNPPNDTSNIYSYLSAVVVIAAVLFPAINVLPWGKSLIFGALLILLLVMVGALQLKNDEKLSEKGFVDLMLIILKKIPPLNWFGKK